MSVIFQIPHTSRFLSTYNFFGATYNFPSVAEYDFGISANLNKTVIKLFRNTVYLIERISFAGDFPEDVYHESILQNPLVVTLNTKIGKQIVYKEPIRLANYLDDEYFTAWVKTDKEGDELQMSLGGSLIQVADLVGRQTILTFVTLKMYAIESTDFNIAYRGDLSGQVGQEVRGALGLQG